MLVLWARQRDVPASHAQPMHRMNGVKWSEAAKKEGKIVVGGPPTDVFRQKFKDTFEKRFGIELEMLSAPGPQNAPRAIAEFKAGVKYFDVLHGGSGTIEPLKYENMLAPFMDR